MTTMTPWTAPESTPGSTSGRAPGFPPAVPAAMEKELAAIRERLRDIVPDIEWAVHAPYIAAIEDWKKKRNAIVLAHNYQSPEVFHGVSDLTGDSLALARLAAKTDAEVIVLCGVHFMAETAKIVNPGKTVLIPDPEAGCSLAASITGADIRLLRERHPGVPVVTYVNTTAEVKAESDICCTSANAVDVVESLGAPRVLFLPDEYLARWVATQTRVEILAWKGHCEVHERFSAADLAALRAAHPGVEILAHPECPPDVLAAADYVGSTSGMIRHVSGVAARPGRHRVVMVTECSMSDNVAAEHPNVEFIRPCALCPHMKRITLPKILRSLERMEHRVEVAPEVAERARQAVDRMLRVAVRRAS